jgi:hypothetical protein
MLGAAPEDETSSTMRENQEGGLGILTEGFEGKLDDGDELAVMDSKTRRRQPACAAPGAANGGTFDIDERGGVRPWRGGPFLGGGTTSRGGGGRINGGSRWWRITLTVSELKQGNRRRGDVILMGDLKEMT